MRAPVEDTHSLPHSEESERAVLAAILLDAERHLAPTSSRLEPEDYYFERHKLLYRAMLALQEAESPIDLRTLQARLEQRGEFESAGGVAYLATLEVDLPDLGRVDAYVEIIKERALRRRLLEACTKIYTKALDGGLEAQEALAEAERQVLDLSEDAVSRSFVPLEEIYDATLEQLEQLGERGAGELAGLPTGFVDLDRMTHGLQPGNLVIVAGRPGMGKTSLALNMAVHVAQDEKKVAGFFSLEMSQREIAMRVLCSGTDIPFHKLRSGRLSGPDWKRLLQARKDSESTRLFVDDSANPSLLEVASKARRLKAQGGLALLVVDYLQLMNAGGRYENRNLEIGAITRGLKQLAKELEVPVVALSQLSRLPERRGKDHRPQLADLRESGNIEQDADVVMFVYREEVYEPDNLDVEGMAELIIAKHRNGETGSVQLVFLGDTTTFRSYDAYHAPPEGPN